MEEHDWLTPTQAAKFAKVSRRTIYNWISAKAVTVGLNPMGNLLVDKNTIFRVKEVKADVQTQ